MDLGRRSRIKKTRPRPYNFIGNNKAFIETALAHERILAGPAETGKTIACLWHLHNLARIWPGLQGAIVRKTYASMPGTVLETFEKKILPVPPDNPESQIVAFGGKRPDRYLYPNGSVIWVGGMDNPDRVLSSERDVIYVNQAEELSLEEWETLATRTTGRAGNMPNAFLMGDCNPAYSTHWIMRRAAAGTLQKIDSRHVDNPTLYDGADWTEQGKRTLSVLDGLTGARKQRLRFGLWIDEVEGALWERDNIEALRVKEAPALKKIGVAIDPAVTATADSNETGIIVGGISEVGHGYVLADGSGTLAPNAWARRAVDAYRNHAANAIIAEVNNGGDLVENTIRMLRDENDKPIGHNVYVRQVRAARGKFTRAEPVSALYGEKRIHHVGEFPELEDQMCTWVPGEKSPDRLDAMVWLFTELMVGEMISGAELVSFA